MLCILKYQQKLPSFVFIIFYSLDLFYFWNIFCFALPLLIVNLYYYYIFCR